MASSFFQAKTEYSAVNATEEVALPPSHNEHEFSHNEHELSPIQPETPQFESLTASIPSSEGAYRFRRYPYRAILNTLFPILIVLFYFFILHYYIWKPSENGIIPSRPINAKGVFFAWLIISIFVLDWAKSGLAGFEAAALGKPAFAPKNARQLLWHADRQWGGPSGWLSAAAATFRYVRRKASSKTRHMEWEGPGGLWFYLACSTILFYTAVPLSGLSIDPKDALQLSDHPVLIVGTNQTNFDMNASNELVESISSRWRQGHPTSPEGASVIYAPDGTPNASLSFYDDVIHRDYYARLANLTISQTLNTTITSFTGPEVNERAHGRAWGLLTTTSCMPVHPYKDLKLLHVKEINDWNYTLSSFSSKDYGPPSNTSTFPTKGPTVGVNPAVWVQDQTLGVNWQYLLASDRDPLLSYSDYSQPDQLPIRGSVELVMWQAYVQGFIPDETFKKMSSHPLVVSSTSIYDNQTYLGYAVRCTTNSTVGEATVSAQKNTFSDFKQQPAKMGGVGSGAYQLSQNSGVGAMHMLVFSAFSSVQLIILGVQSCTPGSNTISCNGWMLANKATNGGPEFPSPLEAVPGSNNTRFTGGGVQFPTISPERMNLAMYKLFGEVSIAAMGAGAGNWTSIANATSPHPLYFNGVKSASDITTGRVPYQIVLVLLLLWVAITVIPQILLPGFLLSRRWGDSLDGFTLFRLGADWSEAVHQLHSTEFQHPGTEILREVPGMIGDMYLGVGPVKDDRGRGFVGLSRRTATPDKKYYYHH